MGKISFVIVMVIGISGCSNTLSRHLADENPKNVLFINWDKIEAQKFIDGTYRNGYDCTGNKLAATQTRNEKLDTFILGVDSYYHKNKNALITGTGIENTIADIIQLGLTGAASFAGGGTPNLLAGIATAINGSKLSFDKNIFADHSSLLLAAKMDQLRLTKINYITEKKLSKDCTKYSLDEAMRDAIDYYYAGTVNGALLAIFAETGNKMQEEEQKSNDLIDPNLAKQKEKIKLKEKTLDLKAREIELNKDSMPTQ
jgi:hypothetical protein